MTNVGFSPIKQFIRGFPQNWSNEDPIHHTASCANSINPKIFWQRGLTQNGSSQVPQETCSSFPQPHFFGNSRSRKIMENTKFFTKTTEFFILESPSPPMITTNDTNVTATHVL